MDLDNIINETILKYYPNTKEYTFEKYPHNSFLRELSTVCNNAETENTKWLDFLKALRENYGFDAVIDYTLFIHKEPSYRCYVKVNDAEHVSKGYVIQLSVLIDVFYVYQQNIRKPINKAENTYYLADKSDTDYIKIIEFVNTYFPSFEILPYELAFKKIDTVKVPNKYADEVFIFDCLFSDRLI